MKTTIGPVAGLAFLALFLAGCGSTSPGPVTSSSATATMPSASPVKTATTPVSTPPAAPKTRETTPPETRKTAPPATATQAGCYPTAGSGNCYEPGEFCPEKDHGLSGVAGDGKSITCEDNNGWRWEG